MYGSPPPLQIIIPALNDRGALDRLLPDLISQGWSPEQITVVDADPTPPLATPVNWITASGGQIGRARQMNLGAAQSPADIFLFLHADTRLPPTAARQITRAIASGNVGGGFSRRFDSPAVFLRVTCYLADLRGKYFGWYFGDQAIFCTREAFQKVGGFPDMYPFEDLSFSRRLKRLGSLCLLKPGILSSARRFQAEGPLRRTLKDLRLTLSYFRNHRKL